MVPIRVAIMNRDDIQRHGLVAVVRQHETLHVVGATADAAACGALLRTDAIDVLVLDDTRSDALPPLIRHWSTHHPGLRVIVLSQQLSMPYIEALFSSGAVGFVYKDNRTHEHLLTAIRLVSEGEVYLSPRASVLPYNRQRSDDIQRVSPRDIEVLLLMQQGLRTAEIAQQLGLSDGIVYHIRRKLREALGVRTSEQLVIAAKRCGLIPE